MQQMQHERRLYQIGQLPEQMQLSQEQIDWLVKTGQLRTILICGECRVDSNDVNELIETYSQITKRKQNNVQ
jgi:hypothetical protein